MKYSVLCLKKHVVSTCLLLYGSEGLTNKHIQISLYSYKGWSEVALISYIVAHFGCSFNNQARAAVSVGRPAKPSWR